MNEHTLGHHVVGFDDSGYIFTMDTDGYTHEHILWRLYDLTISLLEVTLFECLQTEVSEIEITFLLDMFFHLCGDFYDFVRDDATRCEFFHCGMKRVGGSFLDVAGDDTSSENFIVGI